jgi:hypothetical protein
LTLLEKGGRRAPVRQIIGRFTPPVPPGRTVTLRHGRSVWLGMLWSNWCHRYTWPVKLRIAFPGGHSLTVRINGTPQCLDPTSDSTIAVEPFTPWR